MTILLDLPPELEMRLEAEAARQDIPVEEYALALIENSLPPTPPMPELKTGADVVAYWQAQGLIGDWADRKDIADSVEYAGKLREKAQTRAR